MVLQFVRGAHLLLKFQVAVSHFVSHSISEEQSFTYTNKFQSRCENLERSRDTIYNSRVLDVEQLPSISRKYAMYGESSIALKLRVSTIEAYR